MFHGVADTWQVCYIITLPSGQNTVTPVNNIFCLIQHLNRLCSSAPKPVTCLTPQKQENQTDKVQIRASSLSPPGLLSVSDQTFIIPVQVMEEPMK